VGEIEGEKYEKEDNKIIEMKMIPYQTEPRYLVRKPQNGNKC
jgi:hypothetical protein